jgi:DNA-binding transcriptional LysR family regulator
MAVRLPPLTALRSFEAAGRHANFTRAAEELHVTQAAISHQIRHLEEHLGVALFRRLGRKLALTDHGRALQPVLRDAFERIADTIEGLRDEDEGGSLTVTLPGSGRPTRTSPCGCIIRLSRSILPGKRWIWRSPGDRATGRG